MPALEALNRMDDIDHAADPAQFAGYLDRICALESTRLFKQHTFALLGARPGAHVLDVGCGTGNDVRALAELVGPEGRAVGVDASEQLIQVARSRSASFAVPAEYFAGSIYRLDFPADSFDAVQAERVFMHLAEPQQALAEMWRVVKPGGCVLVHDPDWDTLILDASDPALSHRILKHAVDVMVNGRIGRRLWGLFREAGFEQIAIEPHPVVITDSEEAMQTLHFGLHAERARDAGVVSAAEAAAWLADLAERARSGRFFTAGMSFIVTGHKARA